MPRQALRLSKSRVRPVITPENHECKYKNNCAVYLGTQPVHLRLRARTVPWPNAYTNVNTNADTYADRYKFSYANANRNIDADQYSNRHPDPYNYIYANDYLDPFSDIYSDPYCHLNACAFSYSHTSRFRKCKSHSTAVCRKQRFRSQLDVRYHVPRSKWCWSKDRTKTDANLCVRWYCMG